MTNPSAGDTVSQTDSTDPTTNGELSAIMRGGEPRPQCTRKRRFEHPSARTEIPVKTQRRDEPHHGETKLPSVDACTASSRSEDQTAEDARSPEQERDAPRDAKTLENKAEKLVARERKSKRPPEELDERETRDIHDERGPWPSNSKRKKQEQLQAARPTTPQTDGTARKTVTERCNRRDETTRLRKIIQWLEEGARRLREDLTNVRAELHEQLRASKIAKRETEATVREAKLSEAAKYQTIVADLKTRLSRLAPIDSTTCAASTPSTSPSSKVEFMKDENHRREISALKKRLAEAEKTIRSLKWESLNVQNKSTCKAAGSSCAEVRRLEIEIRNLRTSNEKLEEKLRIAVDAEKARTAELRLQHEAYEAELSGLRKSFRSETIKMIDELRGKDREIEKLSKLRRADGSRKSPRSAPKDDVSMRKLRESERNGSIRSISRSEKKFLTADGHAVDSYIREVGCDRAITEVEVERLRELALEQQEVIEILRQALKEKERKLEQLSNKRRKEEFYRQWLELEPVAEVEDEEDHEEGDSALSSAPSSLSPQPGGCGQWQNNGVTREAYEAVLIEVEELQSKLLDERQELAHAKSQVRDLEKALLQETRCANRNKDINALNEKLRAAEDREASLLVELSELREQNELLEFRLLELEESSARRDSPDHTADSGIVSPEPMHLNKDQSNKQRSRAVATVIPYTSTLTSSRPVSPIPRKPPLSLQESGIFEEEDEEEEEDELDVELASCGTQTDMPAGELLQEVQRLQELQARIQERAVKVCPIEPSKSCPNLDVASDESADPVAQLSSYQERIRDLEERLEAYGNAENKHLQEKRLSKQREEELLDENYRLTERVYWLENQLRYVEEKVESKQEGSVNREEVAENKETSVPNDPSAEMIASGVEEGGYVTTDVLEADMEHQQDCDLKDVEVAQAEDCEMAIVSDEEHDGRGQEDTGRERERASCTKSIQTDDLIDTPATICSRCRDQDTKKEDDLMQRPLTETQQRVAAEQTVEEVDKAEEQHEENDADEVDANRRPRTGVTGTVSQVLVVPEEGRRSQVEESGEPVVTFTESESEKKVRHRRSRCDEKEGWAMRTWKRLRSERIRRDTRCEQREFRFVLYQEICV